MDVCRVVREDFEGGGGVPGLGHAVVAGYDDERDSCLAETFECFQDGCVGFGFWFDGIEEVAGVDEGVGFEVDDVVYGAEEVVVDLLLS